MSGVLEQAATWLRGGARVALVSVVAVEGSTPRPLGPAMAVREDGAVAGSVSAGCVDGETYVLALDALGGGDTLGRGDAAAAGPGAGAGPRAGTPGLVRRTYGAPAQPTTPGIAPQFLDLADLGPTILCGGAMTVEVESLGPDDLPRLEARLAEDAARRPLLLVYGAGDIAAELVRIGARLGRRVVVGDHREVFASADRFPGADAVVVDQPERHFGAMVDAGEVDERTAVVVLSHDARIEDPLLARVLGSPAGYVGALGSRRTHGERLDRLRAGGIPAAELARLRGPAGLDLGGVTAAETALSIAAEIVAATRGGTGTPLSATNRAIHAPAERPAGVECPTPEL